eukprot:gnl/Chilomastix_cuspidata/1890.p1 GENE.gnl/Chilomastix_cuspidata/1890~~gnl/Chilomastix_cuspidata/1890.p1  ORF type:complete len:479 (-),score=200.16 gnl/Chilomastix_cuspidata/1890:108-1544(-)
MRGSNRENGRHLFPRRRERRMAALTVQLGQFGNQAGPAFLNRLFAEAVSTAGREQIPIDTWFRASEDRHGVTFHPRACLVDTEPKVVQKALSSLSHPKARLRYPPDASAFCQSGAANNWAYGYRVFGPQLLGPLLEKIRAEAERADRLDAILSLSSLAGGTGSGVGSALTVSLEDFYPKTTRLVQTVLPLSGEVLTQDYNTCLSLAALSAAATGVLVSSNEELAAIFGARLSGGRRPTFAEMNEALALHMVASLLPLPGAPARAHVSRLAAEAFPAPIFKFASARSVPVLPSSAGSLGDSWVSLANHARQMALTGAASDEGLSWRVSVDRPRFRLRALRLVCRGPFAPELCAAANGPAGAAPSPSVPGEAPRSPSRDEAFVAQAADILASLRSAALWSWRPRVTLHGGSKPLAVGPSVGFCVNSGHVVPHLRALSASLSEKLAAGAYLHQYERYGVEADSIVGSLTALNQVARDYASC